MGLKRIAAALVHLLTASGVLCSLLALVAIADHQIAIAFLWLALALFIDAIDGPLARRVDTRRNMARFSGERLDLIVDYLNYVVLPALMLISVPLIEGQQGILAAALVLLSSLYHFSDLESKTADGYFVGFPALWNLVVFYFLAFGIGGMPAFIVIIAFVLLTFVPIRWLHPVRVVKYRWLTALVVTIWSGVAVSIILNGFAAGVFEKMVLVVAALYLVLLGLNRTIGGASSL